MKWTDSQSAVIEHSGSNLLVSAGAGSGKTTVMVEHIIRKIKAGASIDKMLIVTFTTAAAHSMKEKIADALDSAIAEGENTEFLSRQRTLVDRADISTIHAYCTKLLKKYYFKTPLAPDFKIIDSTTEAILKKQALTEVIEQASKEFEDGLFDDYGTFFSTFVVQRNDYAIENNILDLYKFLEYVPQKNDFKTFCLNETKGSHRQDFILDYVKSATYKMKAYASTLYQEYANTLVASALPKWSDTLDAYFNKILTAKTLDEVREILSETITIKIKKNSSKKEDVTAYNASVAEFSIHTEIIKKVRDGLKSLLKDVYNDDENSFVAINVLFDLTSRFSARFEELLLEAGGTTYNGLLNYTIKLLDENNDILQALKNETDYIFVDEYQDVNDPLDWIVQKLSRGNNLFFVGDVKQSIYGFMLAKPERFMQKYNAYKQSSAIGTVVDLANNFRSNKEVIDGINFIFSHSMNASDNGIEYDSSAELKANEDTSTPQYNPWIADNSCANEFLICLSDKENKANDEATLIANRIKSLVGKKIFDPSSGEERVITYGDFAVLTRKNASASFFCRKLAVLGIPTSLNSGTLEYENEELVIFSLLCVLVQKRSDTDLFAVLLSCIGNFSAEELSQIKLLTTDKYFWDRLVSYKNNDQIKEKIEIFIQKIKKYQMLALTMPLYEFIELVYNETGYIYHLASLSGGEAHLAAMDKFIACARTYTENVGGGLSDFINYYKQKIKTSGSEAEPAVIDKNDNSVHCLTIHKSKGLEFPIVILANASRNFSGGNNKEAPTITINDKLGIALKNLSIENDSTKKLDTFSSVANKLEKKQRELNEELRLLYVALTRAQSKLIICGAEQSENTLLAKLNFPDKINFLNFSSYAGLILPLLTFHKDGEALREFAQIAHEPIFTHSNWTVELFDNVLPETIELKIEPNKDDFDKSAYTKKLNEALSWDYAYTSAISQRTKISPSKHSNLHQRIMLRKPAFEDKEYVGAQKGTIVHFFMEHVDFAGPSAIEQANQMLFKGIISKEEFDALPLKQIDAFLASSLCQRIKNSPQVNRERSFCKLVPLEESGDEALIQGIIDCYFFEGEDIVLLDYKTDIIRTTINEQAEKHRAQLMLYAQALEALYPKSKVSAYVYFFNANDFIQIK